MKHWTSRRSTNSKLAIVSREHTVQPERSRQTQMPCQRPSHPSKPDPHQGTGCGPRPWPSDHQTLGKRDNEQSKRKERMARWGLIFFFFCFLLGLDCSERRIRDTVKRSVLLHSEWRLQHQFVFIYFIFKRTAMPTLFCLFSLQLALTSNFSLPFHYSALQATLRCPCSGSRVAETKLTLDENRDWLFWGSQAKWAQ